MDIKKILFRTNSIDVEKALPDAIIFCNFDGKIQWVNDKASEIFETSKMHLLTSNIMDFIENALNLIDASLLSENPIITKFVDKEIYFDMTSKKIDEGFVLSFRDSIPAITYNSLSRESVEEQNNSKNDFLIKLSNELKSPLQSIVGFSQAMADGLGGNMSEQQDKYIRIIRKNSQDLMYFVTKLLELSQTELELPSVEHRTFDIVNVINSVIKFNEQLYKGKEIRWNVNIEGGIKNTIASDENIIKTVLQNVLEVILRAVEMGEISVSLTIPEADYLASKNLSAGKYLMITISSSSMLLSENDLESMFNPYSIIDTTNRKNILRAIILATVKNLIQAIKGSIWVESKILKATSFNIVIPQCDN